MPEAKSAHFNVFDSSRAEGSMGDVLWSHGPKIAEFM